MKNFLKCFRKNTEGATAVEFALVGIPFLMTIFGVMEAGRTVWMMNSVQFAVEETSRFAALNTDMTNEDLTIYTQNTLEDMFVPTDSLLITTSTITSGGIDFVEVDASYTLSTMLDGFLPGDFGNFDFETTVRRPIVN